MTIAKKIALVLAGTSTIENEKRRFHLGPGVSERVIAKAVIEGRIEKKRLTLRRNGYRIISRLMFAITRCALRVGADQIETVSSTVLSAEPGLILRMRARRRETRLGIKVVFRMKSTAPALRPTIL